MPALDPSFTALPYRGLADAALTRGRELRAGHADFRFERVRYQQVDVRDGVVQGVADHEDLGFAVRVVHEGAWGFAAGVVATPDEAALTAERAVEVARLAARMTRRPIALAPEPVHDDVSWVSSYELDPFAVPTADKAALLVDWTERLRAHPAVQHAVAGLHQVHENKYYADLTGTQTTQQRIRLQPAFTAMGSHPTTGVFDSMSSLAPPVGRGWEYLTQVDWAAELAEVPELLAEKLAAPQVEAGRYDLVIHPSNLWLTLHESVGHATELDRVLGYEADYAGTSFATYDRLNTLRYGSPAMSVTGDRTVEHGLATVGYDDEGVQAQQWDLVREGVLVGYQLDRAMGRLKPELNGGRSNGCAYADSPGHVPVQRMANVSLRPAADGPSTEQLVTRVEHGLLVVGDKSWSIDMQRYNFQFTAQRFHRIVDGQVTGQVRDAAYQATTTDFWGALEAVGGPQTWVLQGAVNCGKAQPGQVAAVSHGCPSALFRGIGVLNTGDETGHR